MLLFLLSVKLERYTGKQKKCRMLLSLVVFAPSWTHVRDNRQRTTVQLGRLPPTRIRSCLDSIQLFLITTSTFVPRMQTQTLCSQEHTAIYSAQNHARYTLQQWSSSSISKRNQGRPSPISGSSHTDLL